MHAAFIFTGACNQNRYKNTIGFIPTVLFQVTVALRKQLDYLEPLLYNGEGPISTTDADLDTYHCGDFLNLVKTTSILPLPSPGAIPNLTNWEAGILKSIEDYLHDKIILRRNRRMTKKICSLLQKPRNETYLFALGAGKLYDLCLCE